MWMHTQTFMYMYIIAHPHTAVGSSASGGWDGVVCDHVLVGLFAGSVNPFVILEVENAQVRTHTLYRVTDPVWNKGFLL